MEEDENEGCKHPGAEVEDLKDGNPYKRCRKRANYNKEQITFLMNQFDRNPYPSFARRCRIAKITGIPQPRIQVWFQNRRARHLAKRMKSQIAQSGQFSSTGDRPVIVPQHQQPPVHGHLQIPENLWML